MHTHPINSATFEKLIYNPTHDLSTEPAGNPRAEVPLCVDLDGTLVRTDTLLESFLVLVKQRPWSLLQVPAWLAGGKANFKREIARRVDLPVDLLPYQTDFTDYLRRQKAAGRRLILVTAADEKIARKVAQHIDLFDDVLASRDGINLRGSAKLKALQARFGDRGFDYAGNDRSDLRYGRMPERRLSSMRRPVYNAPPGRLPAGRRFLGCNPRAGGR